MTPCFLRFYARLGHSSALCVVCFAQLLAAGVSLAEEASQRHKITSPFEFSNQIQQRCVLCSQLRRAGAAVGVVGTTKEP